MSVVIRSVLAGISTVTAPVEVKSDAVLARKGLKSNTSLKETVSPFFCLYDGMSSYST